MKNPGRVGYALILAIAVAIIAFAVLQHFQASSSETVQVLVATRDIGVNEAMTSTLMTVENRPQAILSDMDPATSSDRGTVERSTSRAPIFAGEVIDLRRLYGPGLSTARAPGGVFLTKGSAFYPIPTDGLSLSMPGLVAGTYVEIIASLPSSSLTSVEATQGITETAQPIDAHALVASLQSAPPVVTVMVPQHEIPQLAWLEGRHVRFSFAIVRPDDASAPLGGVAHGQFERTYHAPNQ